MFSFRNISISFLIPLSIKSYLSGRSSTEGWFTILLLRESENSDNLGLTLLTNSRKLPFFSSLSVSHVIPMYNNAPVSEICSASLDESEIRFSKQPEQLNFLSKRSLVKGSRFSHFDASKSSGTKSFPI